MQVNRALYVQKGGKTVEVQKKRPLQAVIFDVDGLMLDSERLVMRSWDIAGEKMGYGPLGHNIYHTLGMNLKGREEYFKRVYGEDFPFAEFTEVYREESRKIQEREGVPVKKGLPELMAFLKKEGFALAVATSSSRERTKEKLKGCGVWDDFSVIICGDQVHRSKPDPEIYEKAGAALRAEPGKTLVLEDSQNGLKSALNAGMLPIMIPDILRSVPELEPLIEAKLDDLAQVIPYVEEHFYKEKKE